MFTKYLASQKINNNLCKLSEHEFHNEYNNTYNEYYLEYYDKKKLLFKSLIFEKYNNKYEYDFCNLNDNVEDFDNFVLDYNKVFDVIRLIIVENNISYNDLMYCDGVGSYETLENKTSKLCMQEIMKEYEIWR